MHKIYVNNYNIKREIEIYYYHIFNVAKAVNSILGAGM